MNDGGKSDDSSALVKVQVNDVSALGPRAAVIRLIGIRCDITVLNTFPNIADDVVNAADIEPGDLDFRF